MGKDDYKRLPEVRCFIDSTLREYSEATGYPPPHWRFVLTVDIFFNLLAGYNVGKGLLEINRPLILKFWERSEDKTRRLMRYILAEEFWHYVQHKQGRLSPNPKVMRRIIGLIEAEARMKAGELSGLTLTDAEALLRNLERNR